MIGTHDCATGEKAKGLLSLLVYPFAKTQTKTISEQFEAGSRYFDLRAKYINNELYLAHGIFTVDKKLEQALQELSILANTSGEKIYVSITYEGTCKDKTKWRNIVVGLMIKYSNLLLTTINIKKPKWQCIEEINKVPIKQGYINLDMSTLHSLLPIPWLWNKLYPKKRKHTDEEFTMVDFL